MKNKEKNIFENLPQNAIDFIKLVVKKMRYRRKTRADVQAELAAHFEDALKDCKADEEKEKTTQKLIEDFGDPKMLAVLMRRGKKRCRSLWRTIVARSFQAIGVLILCLAVYIVWFLTGKPVITTNYLEELNRIARPTADESLNAALIYEKAIELFKKSYDPDDPNNIVKLANKRPYAANKSYEITPQDKQLIQNWLDENSQIPALITEASKKPYCWNKYSTGSDSTQLMGVLLPELAPSRNLARILLWRGRLLAEKGQFNDAFEDVKTCYRFGQHIRGNKSLIEQLVGIAMQALSSGTLRDILSAYPIDSGTLADLQKDFENIIAKEDFAIQLNFEKLANYDEIQRCFTEDRIGGGHISLQGFKRHQMLAALTGPNYREVWLYNKNLLAPLHILFTHPNKQRTREMADQYYVFWEKMAYKTPAQLHNENIDINKQATEIVKGNFLLGLLSPAVERIIALGHQSKINVEATLTIIAILRYNQDKNGYPESLNELAEAGYLKELPIDLYSDKPLVYKKTEDGFMLYSFGADFDDDGGRPFFDDEGDLRPWPHKNQDGDAILWPIQEKRK